MVNPGFIAFGILCLITVMWWTVKTKYGGRAFFLSAAQGIAGIFAVNLIGTVTSVFIPVNWFTLGTGALMGLPGITAVLFANCILK